jgi:hypothetical protein
MSISVDISIGEFLDKLSILEIKLEKIADIKKRQNIQKEHDLYTALLERAQYPQNDINGLMEKLRKVNLVLWETEDEIRLKEMRGEFDGEFIKLARTVYKTNDQRAAIKRQANETFHSDLVEEKSYQG